MATAAPVRAHTRIGRFELVRELGKGAQGAVHLALDTHLERQVALKTLRSGSSSGGSLTGGGLSSASASRGDELRTLIEEARISSRLQHPNIVTVYDAGESDGVPYVVFEYVEGASLAGTIKEHGRLQPARAAGIALQLAHGVDYAHGEDVLHRDLKPANVMLTAAGVPRLMDFGIARRASTTGKEAALRGTPAYMAPEYIDKQVFTPACDVFALGVVLYEMLTGTPPVQGKNPLETLYRLVNDTFAPPSRANPEVDERLDRIVMRALAKRTDERYAKASELAEALQRYLEPEADAAAATQQGTLDFLLRRMRHKSDFPVLGSTLSSINRAVGTEHEHTRVLADNVLKDVALTNKLLRIVNAVHYRSFGGDISTVSRAIAILGFKTVRNTALSLTLIEHLHDRSQANALKEEVVACYLSGLVARELTAQIKLRDPEEAFICAMFRRLGRLLVGFYLRDEAVAIDNLVNGRGYDEGRAAREVLEMSFEEIGAGVAKAWSFPDSIISAMKPVEERITALPDAPEDRVRLLAALANGIGDALRCPHEATRNARIKAQAERFRGAGITLEQLHAAMGRASERFKQDADTLGVALTRSPLVARAAAAGATKDPLSVGGSGLGRQGAGGDEVAGGDAIASMGDGVTGATDRTQTGIPAAARSDGTLAMPSNAGTSNMAPAAPDAGRQSRLLLGLQDVTNAMAGDSSVDEVMRIIVATIHRAMGFRRVLLFAMDPVRQAMRCKFGAGPGTDAFVQKGLQIPLDGSRDVFHVSVGLGNDLCIEDVDAEKIRAYVPKWCREQLGGKGMLLLPITVAKTRTGLLYADAENVTAMRFTPEELNLLKTLRNQAVLAQRQAR